jgi:serine protease Do
MEVVMSPFVKTVAPRRAPVFALGFVVASALWIAFFACTGKPNTSPPAASAQANAPAPAVPPFPAPPVAPLAAVPPGVPNEGFAPMLARVGPAVVNIQATKAPRMQRHPYMDDPFFRFFFGGQGAPPERRERSLGSGVIVSAEGVILTNHHVIREASEIVISLADRREMRARIVGSDPKTDIAVLKVDARDLPSVPFADSRNVRVGDLAFAVGSPFGLAQTATFGIVSAVGRGDIGIVEYEDFIQTDAAINPGNSGGALVNARGELIGINTAIVSRGAQGNQGVGFAVPAQMAKAVMDAILKHGRVVRGWLGVSVQEITPSIAKVFRLTATNGVLVAYIEPGSPAEKGGIRRGDVITSIDGTPTPTPRRLRLRASQTPPGTTVKAAVLRRGQAMDVSVVLGELPSDVEERRRAQPAAAGPLGGVELQTLTPRIASRLNLPANARGVLVVSVRPDSLAGQSGLRRGDVIFEVNQRRVRSVEEIEAVLQGGGGALLLIARGEHNLYIPIEP